MKKIILFMALLIVSISSVFAATMDRQVPSQVDASSSFTVRYVTTDATGNFGVLIEDDVTGGCTVAGSTHLATGFLGPQTFADISYTAPASGSCTFTGNYQFSDAQGTQPLVNFPSATATVGSAPPCTPSCAGKACGSDGCDGTCGTCSSGYSCVSNQCLPNDDGSSSGGGSTSGFSLEKIFPWIIGFIVLIIALKFMQR